MTDTKSKKIKRRPDNVEDMLDLAMELSHSTRYTFKYGEAYKLNDYTADGTIFDFMAGVRKVSWHWYNEATITRIKKKLTSVTVYKFL